MLRLGLSRRGRAGGHFGASRAGLNDHCGAAVSAANRRRDACTTMGRAPLVSLQKMGKLLAIVEPSLSSCFALFVTGIGAKKAARDN